MIVENNLEGQEGDGTETRQKSKWKETQKKHQANGVTGKFYHLPKGSPNAISEHRKKKNLPNSLYEEV